jgi:hypothetical protein
MGVQDPLLQKATMAHNLANKFDLSTPEGLKQYAAALANGGAPELAVQANAAAQKMLESQATIYGKTREHLSTMGKLVQERDALIRANPQDPRIVEYNKVIAAEATGRGTVVNANLKTVNTENDLRNSLLTETKPFRDPYIAAGKIENLLLSESALADKISKKQWGKLAGDATISNKDTEALTQYGDLGQRLQGILSQFALGVYSDDQRKEALNLTRQIKANSESQYNQVRTQYKSRGQEEGFKPATLDFVAPPLPKSSVSFVMGKTYVDSSGQQGVFGGYNTDGTPKFTPVKK